MTDEFAEMSIPVSSNAPSERVRFRIQQLLVLTTVMAVMLAVSGPRDIPNIGLSPLVQLAFKITGIIYALVASVAVTIVGYGIVWHRGGRQFFNEPGHWLLVVIAVQQLLMLVIILCISTVAAIQGASNEDVWREIPYGLAWWIPNAALAVFNVYIGRRKCVEARWSRVFYAHAATAVLPVIGELFVLLFLERAVRGERSRRPLAAGWKQTRGIQPLVGGQVISRPRDAAHWWGVAITFFMSGMMILTMFFVLGFVIIPVFFM